MTTEYDPDLDPDLDLDLDSNTDSKPVVSCSLMSIDATEWNQTSTYKFRKYIRHAQILLCHSTYMSLEVLCNLLHAFNTVHYTTVRTLRLSLAELMNTALHYTAVQCTRLHCIAFQYYTPQYITTQKCGNCT